LALVVLWALPGTIAIRHFLIGLGFLFSCFFLVQNRLLLFSRSAIPLFIFLALFIWVISHYLWIGTDSLVQLKELKSIWLRVLGSTAMAIATGIYLQQVRHRQKLLIICFLSIPIFTICYYLYGSYKSHHLLIPNDFVGLYLINKVNVAFFSVICVAICCASFLWGLLTQNTNSKNNYFKFALFGVVIALTSAILASSKNGVGISLNAPIFIDFHFITTSKTVNKITTYYLTAKTPISLPQTPDFEKLGVKIQHSSAGDYFEVYGVYNDNISEFKNFIDSSVQLGNRYYVTYTITLYEQNIRGKSFTITQTNNLK
jgi:hypothetical protein